MKDFMVMYIPPFTLSGRQYITQGNQSVHMRIIITPVSLKPIQRFAPLLHHISMTYVCHMQPCDSTIKCYVGQ